MKHDIIAEVGRPNFPTYFIFEPYVEITHNKVNMKELPSLLPTLEALQCAYAI